MTRQNKSLSTDVFESEATTVSQMFSCFIACTIDVLLKHQVVQVKTGAFPLNSRSGSMPETRTALALAVHVNSVL